MFHFRLKPLLTVLVLVLLLLQYRLWFESGGLVHMWRLQKEVASKKDTLAKERARNDSLMKDVKNLKEGNKSVEAYARHDLGLVKEGETYYQFVEAPPATEKNDENTTQ